MNVFSKYLLKSITEKKGRTILLLISISISAALLVASLGSVKALLGTLSTQVKGNLGEFNVAIEAPQNSETSLFKSSDINSSDLKKSFKSINIGGYLSSNTEKEFTLTGTTLSDFDNFSKMQLLHKDQLEPFTGKKIIISEKTSEALKVKLGDTLALNVLGKEDNYKIVAIASNKGLFFTDKEKQFTLITPEENVFSIYGEKNKYSLELASVTNKDLTAWVKDFNNKNKDNKIVASKLYDEDQIEEQLNIIKIPLYFMLAIVLLMTTFIIYSSFKLIITERLSVIGVFLSQGATKGKIILILLKESLVYGLLGGIIGDLLGAGLTSLISYLGNPLKQYGVKATTEFFPPYFVAGFIFAILLSVLSTIIPILSIRKLPVKDVILNTISTSNKISLKSLITGIIFILIAVTLHVLGLSNNNVSSVPCLFLAFIGIILVIPKIVDILSYPLVRFLRNINGLSMLSFNNVRTSKVLINNIRLIAVSVISIVMITSLSSSLTDVVKGVYDGMNYDVGITVNSTYYKNVDNIVQNFKDKNMITATGQISTNLNGNSSKAIYLDYYDPQKYKTFEDYTVFDNKSKQLDELDKNDDGIILSKQMSKRYNIKKGDTITLTTDNKKEKFKVLSIFNAKMMNTGNYNLISTKAALKHFDVQYPSQYFISTTTPQSDAKKVLEQELKGLGTDVTTKTEQSKNNEDANKQMTNILGIFSYLTMVIGAFGILGNVSISFLQRKREIAVISSIGLTKRGRSQMMLIESIFQAIIGSFISLIAAIGINICLTDILKFLTMDLTLKYPYKSIFMVIPATLLLMILTSLSSIFKSSKLQIVDELKYE